MHGRIEAYNLTHPAKSPRFSGYHIQNRQARFWLPGRAPSPQSPKQVFLEYRYANEPPAETKTLPLTWTGQYWQQPVDHIIDTRRDLLYRYVIQQAQKPDEIVLEETQTRDGFNLLPKNAQAPKSTGSTLLLFRDSVLPPDQLDSFTRQLADGENIIAKRTHFNRLGGSDQGNAFLRQVYQRYGIQIAEDRPIIGGDHISAHGYWTTSLFQANPKISSPSGFEKLALENLKDGARMCLDGAFVNEGFNGIHYLSNLYYGSQSPFMPWFDYGQLNQFPYQPLQLGVLPVKTNPQTGEEGADNAAWDIRLIPPADSGSADPYWVQLYDPRLEEADGTPKPWDNTRNLLLTNSQDSLQPYAFPISKQEYLKKRAALAEAETLTDPKEREITLARLKSEWQNFRLTTSIHDNSGYNWDGQRDVKKINIMHPEVGQYVKEACVYWTDKIDRLYTREVAKALVQAQAQNPQGDWTTWVDSMTRKQADDTSGVLPAYPQGAPQSVTADTLNQTIQRQKAKRDSQTMSAAQQVAQEVTQHFHLATLPAPPMQQIQFNTPLLRTLIKTGDIPVWLETAIAVMQPVLKLLDTVFRKSQPGKKFIQLLQPKSFGEHLAEKLEQTLSPSLKEKLQDPLLSHLVYEEIGRSLYLSLLTGQFVPPNASDEDLNPEKLARGYTQTIPPYIRAATPNQAAKLLHRFLLEQLKAFDTATLNPGLEALLQNITPESTAVARHVLHQRGLGLHWRIDALKDMGDMDGVRALPDDARNEKLVQEIGKVKDLMGNIAQGIRSVFPQSLIKAEITDLQKLTPDSAASETLLANLMSDEVINGIPNYSYLYATGHKAVAMAQRPDGEGESQLSVSDFISKKLKPMMRSMPLEKVFHYQNMTANHDMSTSLYGLALHPHQARYDYYSWMGLYYSDNGQDQGQFAMALNELQFKPQLAFLRGELPEDAFNKLRTLAKSRKVMQNLPQEIAPYTQHISKRPDPAFHRAVPAEAKARYADALFDLLSPQDLKLTPEQHQHMHQAVKALLLEPSETKALRGKLSNTLLELCHKPRPVARALHTNQFQAAQLMESLTPQFIQSLWQLVHELPPQHRRWWGYQQLDFVIDRTIDRLPQTGLLAKPKARNALKQTLFNEAIRPHLEQYKRIAALMVTLPGDPTFYLADLLGQAGGEDLKNMYLGNREAVRYDWLKTNPLIANYFNDLAAIVRQRNDIPALNNGHLALPLDPTRSEGEQRLLNKSPILPLIRDNGKEQVLCLVNFGQPDDAWQSFMQDQQTPRYPEIKSNKPLIKNYSLDLQYAGIPPGTMYQAVDPETHEAERYIVNPEHKLVRADNPRRGIDVQIARTLTRINPA